jgi:hypothetical protein
VKIFGCPPDYAGLDSNEFAGSVKVRVNAVVFAGLAKEQQLVAEVQDLSCIDGESQ